MQTWYVSKNLRGAKRSGWAEYQKKGGAVCSAQIPLHRSTDFEPCSDLDAVCFIEEYKSLIDNAGWRKLLHPVSLLMYALLRFLLKKEEKKEYPVENRQMLICSIVYLILAMAIFASKTLISMKSGDNTTLGSAMVLSIYQQLIRAIPNVVTLYWYFIKISDWFFSSPTFSFRKKQPENLLHSQQCLFANELNYHASVQFHDNRFVRNL